MTEQRPCHQCEATREVEIVTKLERLTVKGLAITCGMELYRCLTCGLEFETTEMLGSNLKSAREAYAQKRSAEERKNEHTVDFRRCVVVRK